VPEGSARPLARTRRAEATALPGWIESGEMLAFAHIPTGTTADKDLILTK
jgi:hypothetical protein